MAPNNALGKPTAAKLRAAAEGERPSRRRSKSPAAKDIRSQTADGFGAGMIDKSEVASRGTGTAIRTPLDEFEAKEKSERARLAVAKKTRVAAEIEEHQKSKVS